VIRNLCINKKTKINDVIHLEKIIGKAIKKVLRLNQKSFMGELPKRWLLPKRCINHSSNQESKVFGYIY